MTELSPEVVRVLVRARELLQRGWCKGGFAKKGNKRVHFLKPEADHFCVMGAIHRADSELTKTGAAFYPAFMAILGAIGGQCCEAIPTWNDAKERTQADVLRLLDGILAKVRK